MSTPTVRAILTSIVAILVLFSSAAPGQAPATDELTRLREENQALFSVHLKSNLIRGGDVAKQAQLNILKRDGQTRLNLERRTALSDLRALQIGFFSGANATVHK